MSRYDGILPTGKLTRLFGHIRRHFTGHVGSSARASYEFGKISDDLAGIKNLVAKMGADEVGKLAKLFE